MGKRYHVGSGLLAKMVALVRWAWQCNLPHASGMLAAASEDGVAVVEDTERVGFQENLVASVTELAK